MVNITRPLRLADAPAAAALHAMGFADPWSEAAFASQITDPATLSFAHFEKSALVAFALVRQIAGEADVLTVATHPARRGRGLAFALLTVLMYWLVDDGTSRITLEVAEDNAPARQLYANLGFTLDGRRKGYYTAGRAAPVDALLMSRPLGG
jgi:[ribosomal protein S18]-alanine N-acetyltransferase